jgi:hypothetical protein
MNQCEGRCTCIRNGATAAALGALAVAAGVLAPSASADTLPLFNGTYTAVQKSSAMPDQVSLWNVQAACGIQGCLAHVVADSLTGFDMMFTGTQWNRLAYPQTGTCNGANVPARSASEFLVPQPDGSLSGAVTSTVDCNGAAVDASQSLTLTPL